MSHLLRRRRWHGLALMVASLCLALLTPTTAQPVPSPRISPLDANLVTDEEWATATGVPTALTNASQALLVHYTARTRAAAWRETAWRTANGGLIDLRYYSDADARALVASHRPQFLATYDSALSPVERADYFRYLVLWVFGGLYIDSDIDFMRPVDQWLARFGWDPRGETWRLLETLDLIVGVEFPWPQTQYDATGWLPLQFTQFVFAGASRSDLLKDILDHIEWCIATVKSQGDVERTIERTGPAAFTRAILDAISARGVVSPSLLATHTEHDSDRRYPLALLPTDELEKSGQLVPLVRPAVTPQTPDFRNRPYDLLLVLPYRAFAYHQAHSYAKEAELTRHRFENSWRNNG